MLAWWSYHNGKTMLSKISYGNMVTSASVPLGISPGFRIQ